MSYDFLPDGPCQGVTKHQDIGGKLLARGLKSHIHREGRRGKPLGIQVRGSNRTKSTVRSRVEHVFGPQSNDMGGTPAHTISLLRAKAKIRMKNLVYNIRCLKPTPA